MTLVPHFAFLEYEFMVRAFIATAVLSLSIAPVGAFLVLRRLSLAGEAMAHAIVPGIVIAFVISGLSVVSMLIGGIVAGVVVALISTLLAKRTVIKEDASLASLYLISLALGIFILSAAGSAIPLKSFLFGSTLGIGDDTLILIGATATFTLVSFAFLLRPLILATIDPVFFDSQFKYPQLIPQLFMFLLVLNLLAAFKSLGTLMAVGLMILPATSARYWVSRVTTYLLLTFVFAIVSCWAGLILSFYLSDVPTGPAIILVAGVIFLFSLIASPLGLLSKKINMLSRRRN